jgi:adenine-specific DNA-methyltransferase
VKAKSKKDLVSVWQRIKTKGLFSWRVKLNEVEQLIETINEKELPTLKNLLYEILDKNQMYVPLSEIADNDYKISQEDKNVCNLFFNQKK